MQWILYGILALGTVGLLVAFYLRLEQKLSEDLTLAVIGLSLLIPLLGFAGGYLAPTEQLAIMGVVGSLVGFVFARLVK